MVHEIPRSKTTRDLAGGESTMQNEINKSLLPLQTKKKKGTWFCFGSGVQRQPWKILNRLGVSTRWPGRFNASAIKSCLAKTWGLGPMRLDAMLLPWNCSRTSKAKSVAGQRRAQCTGTQLLSGWAAGRDGGSNGGVITRERSQT